MIRKAVSKIMLTLLLMSMPSLPFKIQPAIASSPVHNIDTGIDYATIQEAIDAPETSDGDMILVDAGIYHECVVINKQLSIIGENKGTTIIDGDGGYTVHLKADNTRISGFTLRNGSTGIWMSPWSHNHTISDNIVLNNGGGIEGNYDCRYITIRNNIIISNNYSGIVLALSQSIVSGNMIADNGKGDFRMLTAGIHIFQSVNNVTIHSDNNIIIGNTIKNNYNGIFAVHYSESNVFYHNNFVNNTNQVRVPQPTYMINNCLEENYWSDYDGKDIDRNGIGDKPYVIDEDCQDNYPLMGMFSDFKATEQHHVITICNSTVSAFEFDSVNNLIRFNVTGKDGTSGFCRIHIPTALLNATYRVFVDGIEVPHALLPFSNSTHIYLYFTYNHSTQKVVIIPEFTSIIVLPTLLLFTVIAGALSNRKRRYVSE